MKHFLAAVAVVVSTIPAQAQSIADGFARAEDGITDNAAQIQAAVGAAAAIGGADLRGDDAFVFAFTAGGGQANGIDELGGYNVGAGAKLRLSDQSYAFGGVGLGFTDADDSQAWQAQGGIGFRFSTGCQGQWRSCNRRDYATANVPPPPHITTGPRLTLDEWDAQRGRDK